ncbi:SDR family oxidoreductase [Microbacterium sp. NEAU-LLC]|uniref:SDR family oxidoreductase n=1 Tax=Microbacterium helvum TaxID=2773713 RepID=A0ABR8NQ57_9MICO|nr:SDR family oxidoreductase [Microbacterium helvum]MBD3942783.1 SDR family oxidoreductase [Microbacterium helvum]
MPESAQSPSATAGARVAVVTGAGTGIGRAVARAFLDEGWAVVLAGRTRATLDEAAVRHPLAHCVTADVTDRDDVEALFAAAVERFGRVDVLFNNAGVPGPQGSVDELALADWERTLAVNVTGAMLVAGAAVRTMKAQRPQGGRIINNGSIAAHRPRPRTAAYAVSKHAVTGLTRSLALDGRPYGITCGQIDIGNAATALLSDLGHGGGHVQPDGSLKIEPTFDVAEAARTVVFMASLPPNAVIGEVTLTAAGMPWDGRG